MPHTNLTLIFFIPPLLRTMSNVAAIKVKAPQPNSEAPHFFIPNWTNF